MDRSDLLWLGGCGARDDGSTVHPRHDCAVYWRDDWTAVADEGSAMTENAFNGLLYQIITQHREAERNRRLWLRIWTIMAVSMLALLCIGWYSVAQAQTAAVPAYEGGGFAWDYPTGVANHAGFRLTIDGVTGNTQIAKDVRQILFKDTILAAQPVGKAYNIKLVATATAPAVNSAPATLAISYQARPQLAPPTNTRTILEWAP